MNNGDKEIKQKINELGTLSGGIVFGKEEAWEKLQNRLDKEPAKKVTVKFWLAAAAVLLLMCGIVALYIQPVKLVTKKQPAKTNEETTTVSIQETTPAQVENITAPNNQRQVIQKHRNTKENMPVSITIIQPAPPVAPMIEKRSNDTTVIAKTIIPFTPARQHMRMVQINELYDDNKQTPQAIVATTPSPSLKNLPVVHVNDLNDYEQRRRIERYPSRIWDNFAVNVPFLSPYERRVSNDYNGQDYTTHHSLKFKIN